MKKTLKLSLLGLSLPALLLADLSSEAPLGIGFVRDAAAIIGAPLTPMSYAGVARRTTRRVIRRSTIYVAVLPPACTVVVVEGTSLHLCGGTYYQPYGTQYVVVYVD